MSTTEPFENEPVFLDSVQEADLQRLERIDRPNVIELRKPETIPERTMRLVGELVSKVWIRR